MYTHYDLKTGDNCTQAQKSHRSVVEAIKAERRCERKAYVGIKGLSRVPETELAAGNIAEVEVVCVYDVPQDRRQAEQMWVARGTLAASLKGLAIVTFQPDDRGAVNVMNGPHQPRQMLTEVFSDRSVKTPIAGSLYAKYGDRSVDIIVKNNRGQMVCLASLPPKSVEAARLLRYRLTGTQGFEFLGMVTKNATVLTFTEAVPHSVALFSAEGLPAIVDPPKESFGAAGGDAELLALARSLVNVAKLLPLPAEPVAYLASQVSVETLEGGGPLGFVPSSKERLIDMVVERAPMMHTPCEGVVIEVRSLDYDIVEYEVADDNKLHSFRLPNSIDVNLPIGRRLVDGDVIGCWRTTDGSKLDPKRRKTLQWMADDLFRQSLLDSIAAEPPWLVPSQLVHPVAAMRGATGENLQKIVVRDDYYSEELGMHVLPMFDYHADESGKIFDGVMEIVPSKHRSKKATSSVPRDILESEIANLLLNA